MSPQEKPTPHRRAADLVRGTWPGDDEWFDDDVDPADWLPPKGSNQPWNVLPGHVDLPHRWHEA